MNTQPVKLAVGIITGIVVGIIAKDTAVENLDAIESKAKAFFKKPTHDQK